MAHPTNDDNAGGKKRVVPPCTIEAIGVARGVNVKRSNLCHRCGVKVVDTKNLQSGIEICLEDQIALDILVVINGRGFPQVGSNVGRISEILNVKYMRLGLRCARFILLVVHKNMPTVIREPSLVGIFCASVAFS